MPTQQVTTKSQESTSVCEPEYEQRAELEESTDESEEDSSLKELADESEEDSSPKTGELNFRGRLDMD